MERRLPYVRQHDFRKQAAGQFLSKKQQQPWQVFSYGYFSLPGGPIGNHF
jgi:hypothetical protein